MVAESLEGRVEKKSRSKDPETSDAAEMGDVLRDERRLVRKGSTVISEKPMCFATSSFHLSFEIDEEAWIEEISTHCLGIVRQGVC